MTEWFPPTDEELVLRTERLLVRPSRPDDALLLFDHCADPRVSRLMTWPPHREPGETKAFLERCSQGRRAGTGWTWCIFEDGLFRGFVGVESVVRHMLAVRLDRGELGYWLAMDHHRRGLMTEAAGAAVAFAFARLALHKVTVRATTTNVGSLRVIEKLGFTRIGVARQDVLRDGVWHDLVVFEMLATDEAARVLQSRLHAAR